jgi:hypothetical protein
MVIGGFRLMVYPFQAPFTKEKYIQTNKSKKEVDTAVTIIDSETQEWENVH